MSATGIIVARVSTVEQTYGASLEAQVSDCREWAKKCGVRIVKEYAISESGRVSEHRRQFREMLEYRKSNAVSHYVIWDQDRLGRNYQDDYEIQRQIDCEDLNVLIVGDPEAINKNSPDEKRFMWRVRAAMAQMESSKISKRTRRGMVWKLAQGKIQWEAPIGYQNVPDPSDPTGRVRTVIEDKDRASLVKKGFELYASGDHSLASLTDELNRLGFTSKGGQRRPSGPVSRRCVEEFLRNRFYIGEFWDKKVGAYRQHSYPTFITQRLFDRVQRQLRIANRNTKGRRKDSPFYFKEFLRCKCGYQITASEPKPGFRYYQCSQHNVRRNGKRRCPDSVAYSEKKIDALLGAAIGKLYINEDIAARMRERLASASASESSETRREQRRLTARLTERQHHLELIYEDRLSGKITADEYTKFKTKIQDEVANLHSRLASLTEYNMEYQEQGSMLLDLIKGFREMYSAQDYAGKAKILKVVLHRTVLDGGEADVQFQPPFDTLFEIGKQLNNGAKWGE